MHEQWLGTLPCPIVCFEGEYTIAEQLAVLEAERHHGSSGGVLSEVRHDAAPTLRIRLVPSHAGIVAGNRGVFPAAPPEDRMVCALSCR